MTLWAIEDTLAAYAATAAGGVPPEEEAAFAESLTQARALAIAKRDAVSHGLAHWESQAELAGAEIAILQKRKATYERMVRRVKFGLIRLIQSMGKDAKGRWTKLEGSTTSLTLRGCVKAVEVTDEQAVPTKYKRATVTLPAETWELVCDSLDLDLREQVLAAVTSPKLEVSNSLVKKAIDAGEEIPGAKLVGGVYVVRT